MYPAVSNTFCALVLKMFSTLIPLWPIFWSFGPLCSLIIRPTHEYIDHVPSPAAEYYIRPTVLWWYYNVVSKKRGRISTVIQSSELCPFASSGEKKSYSASNVWQLIHVFFVCSGSLLQHCPVFVCQIMNELTEM